MTIAPGSRALTAPVPGADDTSLLPTRETVLDRLTERLPVSNHQAGTLLLLGLLRRDDGWPTPQGTLAEITSLLARSVRAHDWLASAGPAEFVVLMWGPVDAAETVAERLIRAVADLHIPGLPRPALPPSLLRSPRARCSAAPRSA
jgi:GGDEF domain-containing protein